MSSEPLSSSAGVSSGASGTSSELEISSMLGCFPRGGGGPLGMAGATRTAPSFHGGGRVTEFGGMAAAAGTTIGGLSGESSESAMPASRAGAPESSSRVERPLAGRSARGAMPGRVIFSGGVARRG
jgi:hypothetical protein